LADDALVVDKIDTYYGLSHALHEVSFSIKAGQVLVLLGRNGVGKTTTIRSIMGFTPPRSGKVHLFGKRVDGSAPESIAHRGVGLVPQGRGIFPSLTVRENLIVAARRQKANDDWTMDSVVEIFPRLRARLTQLAGTLSGGEQQMLAIGRGLMNNPQLLLMDEPSEGLAPAIVDEVHSTVVALKQRGMTILLVEQNTRLALSIADAVVILNAGRVAFAGDPEQIRNDESFLVAHLGVH
jgi:branched-chain amino acid transport system ATP-binding protein